MNSKERWALSEAEFTLAKHGLDSKGWSVVLSNHKSMLGQCHHGKREISLSKAWVNELPQVTVKNTILHEVSHALAGPGAKHGPEWKRIAVILGAEPRACAKIAGHSIESRWLGRCRNGHEVSAHRAPLRVKSCGLCSRRFMLDNVLYWHCDGVSVPIRDMPKRYQNEWERLLAV